MAVGIASYALAASDEPVGSSDPEPDGQVLDTYFPAPALGDDGGAVSVLARLVGYAGRAGSWALSREQAERALAACGAAAPAGKESATVRALRVALRWFAARERPVAHAAVAVPRAVVVTCLGDLAAPPADAHDVYLRLHLLSHRLVAPHGLNLDGMLDRLTTVAWTDRGPFAAATLDGTRAVLRAAGVELHVRAVDKLPWMTDYIVPSAVRIADAARVRLGAYLAPGTTVMPYGYVNFNAGTLGPAMVEGRISAGTVVGAGSDIGAGASIMGTLSGGGRHVVRVGERCLLGANAGLGISLGNDCAVEAGLYVKADSKVTLLPDGPVVKAEELSGQDDLRFWRNSQTGAIEVARKRMGVTLNEALHKN